jgi:hypothetical protein
MSSILKIGVICDVLKILTGPGSQFEYGAHILVQSPDMDILKITRLNYRVFELGRIHDGHKNPTGGGNTIKSNPKLTIVK